MNIRRLSLMLLSAVALCASARDFFDTTKSEQLLTLGVKVGVNTTNRTIDNDIFNKWNKNYWGTGFDLGFTADLNFRDYLSVQPGIFFQTRSGDHVYITDLNYLVDTGESYTVQNYAQVGHSLRGVLSIPILCRFHFNVTDMLRWSVDAGPYFSWIIGHSDDEAFYFPGQNYNVPTPIKGRTFDFGFKLGSGLTIKDHYYLGIHYLAGCIDAWTDPNLGGSNKGWSFSVGYNF